MSIIATNTAKISHAETGEMLSISPIDLEWSVVSSSERGMGEETIHEAKFVSDGFGQLTWSVSEYPVGVFNHVTNDLGQHKLVQDFDFIYDHQPDDEEDRQMFDEKVQDAVDWFSQNYVNPDDAGLMYVSREGGYQWTKGGPYDAREELEGNFSDIEENVLEEAVNQIQADGTYEWSGADDDFPYFDEEEGFVVADTKTLVQEQDDLLVNIPKQEIGANVTIEDGVIKMATLSPERGNPNRDVLKAIHSELLDKAKKAAQLISPADNQYPELGIIVSAYVCVIDKQIDDINFTSTFIKGIDLKAEYESILRASQTDQTGEYPEISLASSSAVKQLLDIHQTFIGLSIEGSVLLDAFAKASRSPYEERQYRSDIQEFATVLRDTPDLIDIELANEVLNLSSSNKEDPGRISKWALAGRYSRHILILTGTVVTLGVAGGALIASAVTASPALFALGSLASAAYKLTIEDAYKNSEAHKELTYGITKGMNKLSAGDIQLLEKAKGFIKNRWQQIKPIAEVNGLDEWFAEIHSPIYERVNDSIQDILQFTRHIDRKAVKGIVHYCGIALNTRDGSLVACSDEMELKIISEGFGIKKLGIEPGVGLKIIKDICLKMKDTRFKSRVTFYYLLAEKVGKLALFH